MLPRWSVIGLGVLLATAGLLRANPTGGTVAGGAATIGSSGSTVTVIQTTDRAVINWQGFSVGAGETTRFSQPSSTSATLNRVVSGNPSAIYGSIQAPGQVYLINPNGILVGAGAQIQTQSFIASTLDTDSAAFLNGGNLTFQGASAATVQNFGQITASGGDIVLIGRQVSNAGTLQAANGTVALAAGNAVTYTPAGDQKIHVLSGTATGGTGVDQQGTIQAAQAELKAAGGNAYALAVNVGGLISAQGVQNVGGRVYITSAGGAVAVTGTVQARKAGNTGGEIYVGGGDQGNNPEIDNASSTTIASSARLSAGGAGDTGGHVVVWSDGATAFDGMIETGAGGQAEVSGHDFTSFTGTVNTRNGHLLIDPTNLSIDFTNVAALLVNPLATGDLTIISTGDITYNDPALVNLGSTGHKLTLQADGNFHITQANFQAGGDIDYLFQAGGSFAAFDFQALFLNNNNHGNFTIVAGTSLSIDDSGLGAGQGIQFTSPGSVLTLVSDNAHPTRPGHAPGPISISGGTYSADTYRFFAPTLSSISFGGIETFQDSNLNPVNVPALSVVYNTWAGDPGTSASAFYIKATDGSGTAFNGPAPGGSSSSSAVPFPLGQRADTVAQAPPKTDAFATLSPLITPTSTEMQYLQDLEIYCTALSDQRLGVSGDQVLSQISNELGYIEPYSKAAETILSQYAQFLRMDRSMPGYFQAMENLVSGPTYSQTGIWGPISLAAAVSRTAPGVTQQQLLQTLQVQDAYDRGATSQDAMTLFGYLQNYLTAGGFLGVVSGDDFSTVLSTLFQSNIGRTEVLLALRSLEAQGSISFAPDGSISFGTMSIFGIF